MGQEFNAAHMTAMCHHEADSWAQACICKSGNRFKVIQQRRVNARHGYTACLEVAIMADGFRGEVVVIKKYVTAPVQGMFLVYPLGRSLHHPVLCAAPSTCPSVCVSPLSVWVIPLSVCIAPWTDLYHTLEPCFIPSVPASMVRPQQRMLSRRGTSRGGTSRSPVGDSSTHCCHCHGIRSTGANPLQSSQFMDAGALDSTSLPAFGSAIFNFSSSLNCPRISAHVSVLFIEASQEDNDCLGNRGKRHAASPEKEALNPGADPENVSKSLMDQEAKTSKTEDIHMDTAPTAAEEEDYGWCRVVEEKQEDAG